MRAKNYPRQGAQPGLPDGEPRSGAVLKTAAPAPVAPRQGSRPAMRLRRLIRRIRRRGRAAPVATCPVSRASLLHRPVAVGVGDDFHQVAARVVEIDPAAAVIVIDLAGLGPARIGVIAGTRGADAGKGGVKLGVADEKRVMPRAEF